MWLVAQTIPALQHTHPGAAVRRGHCVSVQRPSLGTGVFDDDIFYTEYFFMFWGNVEYFVYH